jgi:hypothetical protein
MAPWKYHDQETNSGLDDIPKMIYYGFCIILAVVDLRTAVSEDGTLATPSLAVGSGMFGMSYSYTQPSITFLPTM